MTSIRKKLLSSILVVIFSVTLLLAIITYFTVREEMDEFYDGNLRQVANTILATGPTGKTSVSVETARKLRGEENYLTQVWINGALEYSSHPNIEFPLQGSDGRGRTQFNESTWRFYKQTDGEIVVQLSQDLKERHTVVLEIYGFLLIPIMIQFPLLAGLIWIMIGIGLKPLSDISSLIKNRNPQFLEPLPQENIPVEINALVGELNDLLSRLGKALVLQRQFTADAAHELRTPLTAVRLQLDILKRAENDDEKDSAVDMLEKGIVRSTRLAQQLLELARQEPENIESPLSEVDVARIVEECLDQSHPIGQAKNISVSFHFTNRPIIMGNPSKLAIMIGNIIGNALTYTKENGHIEITLGNDDNGVFLDIADDGIGISPHERNRVFDRFYRIAGTGEIGSGLGLSIVRNIANLHKAQIQILDGISGRGTNFRVIFPKSL